MRPGLSSSPCRPSSLELVTPTAACTSSLHRARPGGPEHAHGRPACYPSPSLTPHAAIPAPVFPCSAPPPAATEPAWPASPAPVDAEPPHRPRREPSLSLRHRNRRAHAHPHFAAHRCLPPTTSRSSPSLVLALSSRAPPPPPASQATATPATSSGTPRRPGSALRVQTPGCPLPVLPARPPGAYDKGSRTPERLKKRMIKKYNNNN